MVDPGFISYCERQTRDGTPKIRRLAEVSVCILKLSQQLPIVDGVPVESVIIELYPGYQDQKAGLRNLKSQEWYHIDDVIVITSIMSKWVARRKKIDLVIRITILDFYLFRAACPTASTISSILSDWLSLENISKGPSRAFLTSTTVDKINLARLKERQASFRYCSLIGYLNFVLAFYWLKSGFYLKTLLSQNFSK